MERVKQHSLYTSLLGNEYIDIDNASDGQKQMLYLCDVLLDEPNVLVLDEWVSSIDVKRRVMIYEYLKSYKGSVIMVSHLDAELDWVDKKIKLEMDV